MLNKLQVLGHASGMLNDQKRWCPESQLMADESLKLTLGRQAKIACLAILGRL